MYKPVKSSLGFFMKDFYDSITPSTDQVSEFALRGFFQSVVWAGSRMVDKIEGIVNAQQGSDADQEVGLTPKIPVILASISKKHTPVGVHMANPDVVVADGEDEHHFKMSVISGDVRGQVVVLAHDDETAKTLAAEFLHYLSSPRNKGFMAEYPFTGLDNEYPVQVEAANHSIVRVDVGSELSAMAVDVTLRCLIPQFHSHLDEDPSGEHDALDASELKPRVLH